MEISSFFTNLLNKTGKYSTVIAIFAVSLQYWNVLHLENINPFLINFLYLYIIASGIFATPFIYFEKRPKILQMKTCPQCNTTLEMSVNYNCPKCGKLVYEK